MSNTVKPKLNETQGKQGPVKRKIHVICRVRPFLINEVEDDTIIIDKKEKTILIQNLRNPSETFYYNFDNCYDSLSTQTDIFKKNALPLLDNVIKGLDATIFCYGMTGAGKTYTLEGTESDPGLIPKCLRYLFKKRQDFLKINHENEFTVTMSYMEVYKETVFDLLLPREQQSFGGLNIRENSKREIFVADLTHKTVNSINEFLKEFNFACRNRSTASTKLNTRSSRSHAILTINIKIKSSIEKRSYIGKLSMIDLAGSEDNRRTGNNLERMAESGAINKSLFVLGQVVDAINSGAQRVPYRDSKMTRILQPSLSGKSLGMIIVNIAPGQEFFLETQQALNFAIKSKKIISSVAVKQFKDKISPLTTNNDMNGNKQDINRRKTSSLEHINPNAKISPNNNKRKSNNAVTIERSTKYFNGTPSKLRNNLNRNSIESPENKKLYVLNSLLNKKKSPSKVAASPSSDAKEIIRSRAKLDNAVELVKLAQSLRLSGNLTDSLKYYVKANESAPDDPIIQQRIAELCNEIQLSTTPPKKGKALYSVVNQTPPKKVNPIRTKQNPSAIISQNKCKIGLFIPSKNNHIKDEVDRKEIKIKKEDSSSGSEEWKYQSEEDSIQEEVALKPVKKRKRENKENGDHNTSISKIPDTELEQYSKCLDDPNHPLVGLINTGNIKMIKSLYGVGPKKANIVIEQRKERIFSKLDDLKEAGFNEKAILRILFAYHN
ncbi:kinesin-domain-containing protein [Neoconidiobolus thromboides FSU 785]|nr:kinesin-domain-containing protein [Neoconidiobolus thromboides FSU 785]